MLHDHSRRTILKAGLAAAAASSPLSRALAAEGGLTVLGAPLGLQLYSLRQHLPKDVPGTLAKIRAMGFREVEGGGDYGLGVAGFLAELKKADLRVTSAHFDYKEWAKDAAAQVARATALGVRCAGTAWIPHQQRFTREDALGAALSFNKWGAAVKAAGMRFMYHIHGYEFETASEGTLFDTLAKATDPALVSFQADVFWVRRGGCDPMALFERYPGRFVSTHLKDIAKGTEVCKPDGRAPDETSVPLGEGMIDWPGVLRAAQKAGVQQHYIEDEHPNALEQIPRTLRYLAGFA